MNSTPVFPKHFSRRWAITLAICLFSASLEPMESEAQSGRRGTRQPSSSAAISADPATEKETQKPLGALSLPVHLLVARQATSRRLYSEDKIFESFIKQLNRYENIDATSIGDLKEERAVERARSETDAYVILMKFDIDSFQNGTIITNSEDLQIEYLVMAPKTAKKETKGKVYFQTIGGGRMRKSNWPNGTPIRITPEGTGMEAADGLYFWLKLVTTKR